MTKRCEICGSLFEMDVTAVTNIGLITADLCMRCGLMIHDTPDMIIKLVRKRATERNIVLPADPATFAQLLQKEASA